MVMVAVNARHYRTRSSLCREKKGTFPVQIRTPRSASNHMRNVKNDTSNYNVSWESPSRTILPSTTFHGETRQECHQSEKHLYGRWLHYRINNRLHRCTKRTACYCTSSSLPPSAKDASRSCTLILRTCDAALCCWCRASTSLPWSIVYCSYSACGGRHRSE